MVNPFGNSNSSSNTLFQEYLTASRFYVEIHLDGSKENVDGLFMECKGLNYTQDVIEFSESNPVRWGSASATRGRVIRTKIPGNAKVGNISLRRGMNGSSTLWQWIDAVQNGNWANQYRDGSLTVYRQAGSVGARFQFRGAWPFSYSISESTANGSELLIESMEFACEELFREPADTNRFSASR
jgi:phage tail-like protein